MDAFQQAWMVLKARRPLSERPQAQKVATVDGSNMSLSKWANRLAAEQMRAAGKAASGPEWEAMRDSLMREAVMDPAKHGLGFLSAMADDGMPHLFPGQVREEAAPMQTEQTMMPPAEGGKPELSTGQKTLFEF